MKTVRASLLVLVFAGLGCASARPAETPLDWQSVDAWSIHVVTTDSDGDPRVTRIWYAVLDGAGVIRTKDTRWWRNLQRGSHCSVRIAGSEYPVDVEVVHEPEERRRIDAAFLAHYGWQERLFIGSDRAESADPYMRLAPLAP